mgnify:CR=1 FL=1
MRQCRIQILVERKALGIKEIKELSPHSKTYIIPHIQLRSKRYGLILDNKYCRNGAEDEANSFRQSLEAAGFNVKKFEWEGATDLMAIIDDAVATISTDCSLLLVSLMSHGSRGMLGASDGKSIPVNHILQRIYHSLPPYVPLVGGYSSHSFSFLTDSR